QVPLHGPLSRAVLPTSWLPLVRNRSPSATLSQRRKGNHREAIRAKRLSGRQTALCLVESTRPSLAGGQAVNLPAVLPSFRSFDRLHASNPDADEVNTLFPRLASQSL